MDSFILPCPSSSGITRATSMLIGARVSLYVLASSLTRMLQTGDCWPVVC